MIDRIQEALQLIGKLPAWVFSLWILWIGIGLGLVYFTATVLKNSDGTEDSSEDPPKIAGFILEVWKREQSRFLEENGIPANSRDIRLWYQFFERGLIIYNSVDSQSWILHYPDRTYWVSENPDILVSQHHVDQINWNYFEELVAAASIQERRSEYARLITDRKIIGGIGTIYIREDLQPRLGDPVFAPNSLRGVYTEAMTHDAILLEGDRYVLLVGLPNRPSDLPGNLQVRAVFAFFSDQKYRKFVVDIGDEEVPWEKKEV